MALIVYPGTFDPITHGHVDLVLRASKLFDQVIVAVAVGYHKKALFAFEDRLHFVVETFKANPKVKVLPLDGLLVEFAKHHQAQAILRGLRTAFDFEYEFQLAGMNRSLDAEIETVFMTPSQNTLFISATLVRELILLKGDVAKFVPKVVMEHLTDVS